MAKTAQDPDISSVEELDGEPSADRRVYQRRELWLGVAVLLLVAVLGFGYWRQDETQRADYRAGEQAAAAHHWDEARARFLAAGGYPNAKARADQAAGQIAERDKQYKQALTALARYDGIAALQALDALEQIEEGYGGADLLRSEAHTQLYTSALEGVVARRSAAHPPGLYYRSAADWVWLQGSDLTSTIHNYGNGDYIVYDVPGAGGSGGSAPARQLMVAHFSAGAGSFTPVALNAQARVFWGAQGGWSYADGCSGSAPAQLRGYYCAAGMVYSAAGSVSTTPVRLPGADWIVVDLAPDGSAMLVAHPSATGGATPHISLYRSAPDGSNARLLYEEAGWLERAAFSQDSRAVVATVAVGGAQQATIHQILALDAAGQSGTDILNTVAAPTGDSPLSVDFVLLTGTGAGRVAIVLAGSGQTTLQIADLAGTPRAARTIWVKPQFQGPMLVTRLEDGGVLVCGQVQRVSTLLDNVDQRSGECVQTDSAAHETTFDLPLMARYGIGYAWPRQGSIIYPIAPPGTGATGVSIMRIAPAPAGTPPPPPTVILELPLGTGQALNLVAGAGLLAYARQGQLHVRSYDGTVDLSLEEGVDLLFDLRGAANSRVLF